MKSILVIAITLFSCISYAQLKQNFRADTKVVLKVGAKSNYEMNTGATPVVLNDSTIQIYPGEKLFIDAEIEANRIKNLKAINEPKNNNNTIIIEFSQISDGPYHKQMKLAITNPFDSDLLFNSHIYLMKFKKWTQTNTLPVEAGKTSYELWPDIITTIILTDFTLQKK